MAREKEYERLPGRGKRRGFFNATYSRLWLARDHLLLVDLNIFVETYKRFAFRDIEAVTVTRTARRMIWNLILMPFVVFFGIWALRSDLAWTQIPLGVLAAIFFLLVLINSLRGPTCRCHLTTAVQTDELASLRRISRAERVLSRLKPLIAEAQAGTGSEFSPAPNTGPAVSLGGSPPLP